MRPNDALQQMVVLAKRGRLSISCDASSLHHALSFEEDGLCTPAPRCVTASVHKRRLARTPRAAHF